MSQEYIEIRGARENNLKNVSLRIPKRKITIFAGDSGSGKIVDRLRYRRDRGTTPDEREFQHVHPHLPAALLPAGRRCH